MKEKPNRMGAALIRQEASPNLYGVHHFLSVHGHLTTTGRKKRARSDAVMAWAGQGDELRRDEMTVGVDFSHCLYPHLQRVIISGDSIAQPGGCAEGVGVKDQGQ